MLCEGYLANLKNYPKNELTIPVTRTANHILAPSYALLKRYKDKVITWEQYVKDYRYEILSNMEAINELRRIRKMAETMTVRLICYEKEYPCHRFLLLSLVYEV